MSKNNKKIYYIGVLINIQIGYNFDKQPTIPCHDQDVVSQLNKYLKQIWATDNFGLCKILAERCIPFSIKLLIEAQSRSFAK